MVSAAEIGATVAGSLALIVLGQLVIHRIRRSRYPPGPPALPIIGNVLQLPSERQDLKLHEWSKIYGDLMYLQLFQTSTIIISSVQVARDLLEKRGANYSERPYFNLLNEFGWDCVLSNFNYSDPRFRKHRKWIHDGIQNKEALRGYEHIQHRETCIFLQGLLDNPEEFEAHIKQLVASVIVEIAYGHKVTGPDDELVSIADTATTEMTRTGSPGASVFGLLIEFFPTLARYYPVWLPGSGLKTTISEVRGHVRRMFDVPYNMVKERAISGGAVPCLTASLLEDFLRSGSLTPADEVDIKGAAAVLYGAGTDTSVATMTSFILAMVRHPEAFKKAQKEIDRVIGNERLPDLDDRASLPFLECVLKEVLRWMCPLPLGLPHCTARGDVYQGYEIPAKAMVIPNAWTMLRDPKVYPEPEKFRPERFEGLDSARTDEIDPRNVVFGFGRRQCPGRQLAEATTFLMAARVIATMDIHRARDEHGNEIIPPFEFHPGLVLHPKPFKCVIHPRSEKSANMIRQMHVLVA